MTKQIISFLLLAITLACGEHHFDDDSYDAFELITTPDSSKTYYPEEVIIFTFNSDIDATIVEKMELSDGEGIEFIPTISVDKNRLEISDLPPQNDIIISFLQGVRSVDNRLLTESNEHGITSKRFDFNFHIGPALPQLISTLPENRSSATVAVAFSAPVRLKKENIIPEPDELITEASTAILLYDHPQPHLLFSGITTPLRPGVIPDIVIDGVEKEMQICTLAEPEITTNDNSIQILFSGNCLLAFQVGNMTEICQNGRCSIVKENLNPESYHAFDVTLFSIDGAHKESLRIKTKMAEAHIMISEVMHSPSGEPEKNHEFVEIYNATSLPFDLANCMIDDKNDKKGVDPLLSDETVLAPGATALIVGNESMIVAQGAGNILFVVDDTTIADAGLTSTESIQIICPSESGEEIVASYSVSEYGKRGFSVVIEKDGTMCDSIAAGGTPGVYSECP